MEKIIISIIYGIFFISVARLLFAAFMLMLMGPVRRSMISVQFKIIDNSLWIAPAIYFFK